MSETNAKSSGTELMEPASPEALIPDIGLWPLWLAAGITLALLLILTAFLRRRSRPTPDPSSIRNAAYSHAIASFDGTTTLTPRDAAIQSSLILRKYLCTAADDPALFETHEEFLSRHDALQALDPATREAAATGFNQLASLKYASEIPLANTPDIITEAKKLLHSLHQGFMA